MSDTGTVLAGNGVASASVVSGNSYVVEFTRTIDDCGLAVTPSNVPLMTMARVNGGQLHQAFVQFSDRSNLVTAAFSIMAACPP